MEAKAVAKYVRMSPSKLKPVTDPGKRKGLERSTDYSEVHTWKGI